MSRYDFIIVGSGFGGAVAACRLAQAGQRVLVLERGRRWDENTYPSVTGRDWIYDIKEPERQNGWMDLRWFSDMAVVQGAGVGGGSLIYANVSVPPPAATFEAGWPDGIDANELEPFVERVGRMLEVSTIPESQRTKRWGFVERGARELGHSARFRSLPLAVQFDPGYNPDSLEDPHAERHAVRRVNQAGVEQKTCIHLGECDMGCRVKAKNTLDLNYLALAAGKGAEIRPLHVVNRVEPSGAGWRIHYDEIAEGKCRTDWIEAEARRPGGRLARLHRDHAALAARRRERAAGSRLVRQRRLSDAGDFGPGRGPHGWSDHQRVHRPYGRRRVRRAHFHSGRRDAEPPANSRGELARPPAEAVAMADAAPDGPGVRLRTTEMHHAVVRPGHRCVGRKTVPGAALFRPARPRAPET